MAAENLTNSKEIIDATQNAVINAAGNVAEAVENVGQEISGHGGPFYESPEFWVGLAFVAVVVLLARPVGRLLNVMLNKRIDGIANRITEVQKLNEDAQKLLAEYEKKYLNAEKEARNILKKSEREIEFLKDERLKKLENEMSIKQKEAESRIKAAQDEALREITNLTSDLTIAALKKALEQNLSDKTQDQLIDESIAMIEKVKV